MYWHTYTRVWKYYSCKGSLLEKTRQETKLFCLKEEAGALSLGRGWVFLQSKTCHLDFPSAAKTECKPGLFIQLCADVGIRGGVKSESCWQMVGSGNWKQTQLSREWDPNCPVSSGLLVFKISHCSDCYRSNLLQL